MSEQHHTPTDVEITDADLRATEEVVAGTALKSDKGWEILRQLYLESSHRLLTTQGFTFPVLNNIDALKEKLSDPEGFQKSMQTLIGDLKEYKERLDHIYSRHLDKSGKPTEAEWPIMFALSQEYSDLMNHFDNVISPLIFSLVDIISREYGELLEMPANTNS